MVLGTVAWYHGSVECESAVHCSAQNLGKLKRALVAASTESADVDAVMLDVNSSEKGGEAQSCAVGLGHAKLPPRGREQAHAMSNGRALCMGKSCKSGNESATSMQVCTTAPARSDDTATANSGGQQPPNAKKRDGPKWVTSARQAAAANVCACLEPRRRGGWAHGR